MSWWQFLPVFLVAVAVLLIPGAMVLAAAGVRRLDLAALSMPVTLSIAGVAAVIAPIVRLPYNALVLAVASVLAAAVVLAVRLVVVRRARSDSGTSPASRVLRDIGRAGLVGDRRLPRSGFGRWAIVLPIAGAVVGGVLIAGRLIAGFHTPNNFSQTFDNIFHLNAVHHIAETQNGSSLTLGNLTEASQAFYPAAMHDIVALVEQLGGVDSAVAMNAAVLVIAAIAWPLACMFLVSRVVGYRPLALLLAGILSAGFSASPYLLIGFGVLYPLMTAMVISPVVLGLVAEVLRLSSPRAGSWLAPGLALVAVMPGFALTHPSAVIAIMALSIPLVVAAAFRAWRGKPGPLRRRIRIAWAVALPVYLMVFLVVWLRVRPNLGAAPWGATQTTSGAIGEVAASSPMGAITAWVYLFGTLIGAYAIIRSAPGRWWLIGSYVVAGALYVFAAGWGSGPIRTFMVGVWYNDPFRLAALLPVATLPIVVIGVGAALLALRRVVRRAAGRSSSPRIRASAAFVGALAVLVAVVPITAATQRGSLSDIQRRIGEAFALDADSDLVTPDELALMRSVGRHVPEDGVIVGNPLTGAGLVYAFGDRSTVAPHVFGERTDDEQLLLRHWDEAAFREDVCPVIRETNAYWALDFGRDLVIRADEDEFRGVDTLTTNLAPEVELVAEQGAARLWRITACD